MYRWMRMKARQIITIAVYRAIKNQAQFIFSEARQKLVGRLTNLATFLRLSSARNRSLLMQIQMMVYLHSQTLRA